uniref:ARAD1A19690p n=1 Tax=Blastobotrys adeninivorans TaxID=409370 RepID=A0A060SYB7_BLAAD
MIQFVTDLWTSILTPGTTPTLVKATHASFAALVLLLLAMLAATWSYHFIIMTLLALGVWGGITWFINEIEQIKLAEQEKEKTKEKGADQKDKDVAGVEGSEQDKAPEAIASGKGPQKPRSRKV